MINHTPLYHELYKFTNEYKNSEAKKLINKFIFKQPSVYTTDGCNFINSNDVYSNELDIIPDAKIYFNSANNTDSFYNNHIKLCIPFSEINGSKNILNNLNRYIYKSITINNDVYKSSIESLNIRNINLNNKYPLSKFRENIITKWLYDIEFNVKEFYDATGIYLFITRRKNDQNSNDIVYYSSCINSNYNLDDGLNVRISVKNNTYLEINFIDRDMNNIEKVYELSLYYNSQGKIKNDFITHNSSEFDFMCTDIYSIMCDDTNDIRINSIDEEFEYDDKIYKSLINTELVVTILSKTNDSVYKRYKLHLYDYEYDIYRKSKTHIGISLNLNNSSLKKLLDNIDTSEYDIDYKFNLHIKKYNLPSSILERKDYLEKYSIYNDSYFKSSKISSDMSIENISNSLMRDEENIKNCLPFSLEYILNRKSTFNIHKIEKILYDNIEFKGNIPYIKYNLNSKHDTVMFFKDSKLVIPEIIETEKSNYDMYIPITDMISDESFENLRKMKHNIISKSNYIDLKDNSNLWIVYDTDRHFIENMRYDLKSIYIYVNINNTFRYSLSVDENNKEIYILDSNGEYIKYRDNYLELGSKEYYLVDGKYILEKPDNYTGDIYRKTKTNEYLLPLNKDIDPSKIIITIEDYHDHDNLKYIKDPKGSYVYLENDTYYTKYNTGENKDGLYIFINNEYILYDKYNETHLEYKGNFYIKKKAGYVIPPYYRDDDDRYRKISKTCIVLSNIFNMSYDDEVVSVDSYYSDGDSVIRDKTYNKDSFVNEMLYKKYGLRYPINDLYYKDNGKYKLYNSILNIDINNELYYKVNDSTYISKNEVDIYVSEIRNFINMNRVYKFSLNNKEILDIDNNITTNYTYIDAGTSDDTAIQYIFINGGEMYKKDIDGNLLLDDDENPIEYMNDDEYIYYESNYDIEDNNIHSYTYGEVVDGGYANTDEYMSVLDGGYSTSFSYYPNTITKEEANIASKNGENVYIYVNDKPVLYKYYLYPDYDGPFYKDFSTEIDLNENYKNNELFIEDDYPVYDFNFTSPYSINDKKVKAYRIDSSYSNYFNSDDEFLAFVIPNQLINSENKLLTFLDGKFTDEFAINKNLYSRLFGGDTILSITEDPKNYNNSNIHNLFMCNMKNLSLYQNSRGISYKDKIFSINNSIDTIVHNERKLYKDIYFPPLSLKYMLFFINGKFANPFIEILTPQRFIITNNDFLNDGEEINDIQIYAYDKYLYNLSYYKSFFNTNEDINKLHGYNIYTYKDNMWNEYKESIIESIKSNDSIKAQIYIPKDTGYHAETSLVSLYEIFGKYILNKYDIDNDPTLSDEIREYFAPLFDENNRMKLELIQDQIKRKYIY